MITFVHTADVHFGMENYGKIDPKTGIHSRLLDFENALNFCIDYAIEYNVDFFVFSGDAYKTATPSPTQQKLLMRCLMRLYKAGIPIIIIVGNHDNPLSFGKANSLDVFSSLPVDGFYVISKPTSFVINTRNGPVQIVGIPWPSRNNLSLNNHIFSSASHITEYISLSIARIIEEFAKKLDPNIPAILASHITVSSGVFSGSEKRAIYGNDPVLLPSQLAIEPFDYIALGHLHRFQNLNQNGKIPLVYAGSIERIDFGERKEKKGFCHVKIKSKNETIYEFIEVPTRPFIQIDTYLQLGSDPTEQLINIIRSSNIKDSVVKIVYHVPSEMTDSVNLRVLQQECMDAIHIAGIIPIRNIEGRQRRAGAKVDMDLSSLLSTYFDSKSELKTRKDSLIQKTLELQQCCAHEES